MDKVILYPFSVSEDNKVSFVKTINLAKELSAKVVCFSTTLEETDLDDAYLHLLTLNGHYQTNINDWKSIAVKVEPNIKIGEFETALGYYLANEHVDILIHQTSIYNLEDSALDAIINKSKQRVNVFFL